MSRSIQTSRTLRTALPSALVCAAALAFAGAAQAQVSVGAIASIAPGAATSTTGALTVNETAGLDNAQANQLTITTGNVSINVNGDEQLASVTAQLKGASATIGAGAFANTNGAMMVNQSAGVGNIQRNTALISSGAIGVVAVSDGELSKAAAQNGGQGQMAQAGGIREVRIDNAAFRNATGLVQVNQTAGAGNATANSFVLRPPAGTLF
ncbi:hypothetical protein E1N52_15680 [Paraburkholderia guartelaensis]|jgi:hypothetical protein|uniref:Adhesin n=1 Tax=Paraburkholderia guartelaensis TaxID=2546446 RepID=A0A4R5LFY2_9BURK|nr:hypothetical protein [Paraburkholderia guartelaensis]TDG07635.1 hypothetical protein E1N52_15680 [Paraburkholderia guartelaensis]